MNQDFLRRWSLELSEQANQAVHSLSESGDLDVLTTSTTGDRQASHLFWSRHADARKTTAIVSSRLGRELGRKDAFFRTLRIACSQLDPRTQVLLSAEGTTTHPYVDRAAELFGLDLRSVVTAKSKQSLEKWLLQTAKTSGEPAANRIFVSPPLPDTAARHPARDAFVIQRADQVLAIHIREQGTINALLQQRLKTAAPARVFLAVGCDQLVPKRAADPLMRKGAVGWFVMAQPSNTTTGPFETIHDRTSTQPILRLDGLCDHDCYLTHCTRSADGPWPDQSKADYLDELIMGDTMRDHSAFAALMRILGQRRILATGEAIRHGIPVVSLTAVSLRELSSLRRYRAHRGRWDFEPYGIAMSHDHLIAQGARKVIYGGEDKWHTLSAKDKPFFQKLGDKENSIDWRIEKEYRLLEDIDLNTIPCDKAVVLVPSPEEAKHVAKISDWPVVVMEQD